MRTTNPLNGRTCIHPQYPGERATVREVFYFYDHVSELEALRILLERHDGHLSVHAGEQIVLDPVVRVDTIYSSTRNLPPYSRGWLRVGLENIRRPRNAAPRRS